MFAFGVAQICYKCEINSEVNLDIKTLILSWNKERDTDANRSKVKK